MQKRHKNREQYFIEQGITTEKYVIPYIEEYYQITPESKILEIGCGEGGNLAPFIKKNCTVVGVDINHSQIENAKSFLKKNYSLNKTLLINNNIYNLSKNDIGTFDIIMLRDVIEHIPNQNKLLKHLKNLLKDNGLIFIGFPPWIMPFGGHQQICKNKILSNLPYFHILPNIIYKNILKLSGENKNTIKSLINIKKTRMSINEFQNIVKNNNLKFIKKTLYLINPNYEIKFKFKPKKQFTIISKLPYIRDFFTTCCYSLICKKQN